jgi:hypothetical protein
LTKRREALQERTPKVKGKRKEYTRVYKLDKMQNETEEEGTNRLQKRKQDRTAETVDERARILEILRAHFHTAISNENYQESHEQLSMSVDPTVDISVPDADKNSEYVHEAEGPEVSINEYLHESGWQNIDNPLHELEFVQNEMYSFHLDQEHLEHRQCVKKLGRHGRTWHQKYLFVTGARETRNHPRNVVPRMTWTQEQFLNN